MSTTKSFNYEIKSEAPHRTSRTVKTDNEGEAVDTAQVFLEQIQSQGAVTIVKTEKE